MSIAKKTFIMVFLVFPVLFLCISSRAKASEFHGSDISAHYFNFEADSVLNNADGIDLKTILRNHIPKPFNAILHSDNLEFKGKWKTNVMPAFLEEMKKMGWVEIKADQQSTMQYFQKTIHGSIIKISIVPAERGGPEEENASTFIYFKIIT